VFSTEACAEPFDFMGATTFPRPQSEPIMAPPQPIIMRQPRDNPQVLGEDSNKGSKDIDVWSQLEARRQPRASNAPLSSISRRPASVSSLSLASAGKVISVFTCVSHAEALLSYRLDVRLSVCQTLVLYQNG